MGLAQNRPRTKMIGHVGDKKIFVRDEMRCLGRF